MDGDSNDNTLIVGYYDRSPDSSNVKYQNSFVITTDAGAVLRGPTSMTPGAQYDPTVLPFSSGEIGDYQGMGGWNYSTGPQMNSAYIRAGSTWAVDAWVTGIR